MNKIMKLSGLAAAVLSLSVFSSQSVQAALVDRGGGLIYDTDLGITWMQRANIAAGTWGAAMAFADAYVYEGYDDWRLPTSPATRQGFINEGEIGHLYYTTLGNVAGSVAVATGPFFNISQLAIFWLSSTPLHPGSAWNFEFSGPNGGGLQNASSSDFNNWSVWLVRDGDSTPFAVVEPGTIKLMLLALGALGWVSGRSRTSSVTA